MRVDIWSDIRCPFCYIGKRKLETALQQFSHEDEVEIEWHSFELEPDLVTTPGESIYHHLAKRKGMSKEQSVQMHRQMKDYAASEGLDFNFDSIVVANSFDAHRLIHMGKSLGLGDKVKERLLRAYFTEGGDISDKSTLVALAGELGMDTAAVKAMLDSDAFANEVRADEAQAQEIGINGVPFFVINQRYAVSGAQTSQTFLQALDYAWAENEKEAMPEQDGPTCDIDGNC